MLSQSPVHAALPAANLDRARRFYAETLGLEPTGERAGGLRYDCAGGTAFFLFPTAISERGGHTQAGFEVPDIEAAVADLRSRGVVFEDYDVPGLAFEEGIATEPGGLRAAWFRDSEGNVLVLVQVS